MKTEYLYFAIPIVVIAVAFTSCSEPKERIKPAVKKSEIQGEFRSRSYPVSEYEHVVIYDVPDRWQPLRCWVFVNEKTNTTNMHCDDEGNATLPELGPALEK